MARTPTVLINARVPSGMNDVLRARAKREGRSLTAVIIMALERGLGIETRDAGSRGSGGAIAIGGEAARVADPERRMGRAGSTPASSTAGSPGACTHARARVLHLKRCDCGERVT